MLERIYIDDKNERMLSYYLSNHGSDNRPERARMRRILYRAIRHELTDRQRECLTQYYLEGKKMKEIARDLGISGSTVSRHISSSLSKLRKVAGYYIEA